MNQKLPYFRYHPAPMATGAVTSSDAVCICCGKARGFIYVGPVYSTHEPREPLCPWCIADGSAASRLDAQFSDSYPLVPADPREKSLLSQHVVDEVLLRTPGYVSWQSTHWLSHCQDACEFHGDASAVDVKEASPETKRLWAEEYSLIEDDWDRLTQGYVRTGDSALYKFMCRHCKQVLFAWDMP